MNIDLNLPLHESEVPRELLQFFDEISEQERPAVPCVVGDVFAGSGTTGAVALELGRKAVLIELNPTYVKLIEQRCNVTIGLALA